MSKFVDDLKKDIEGMEARHEQHKELRHEKHEEKKFARELKHQMKHEEHEKVKQGRKVAHEEKKEEKTANLLLRRVRLCDTIGHNIETAATCRILYIETGCDDVCHKLPNIISWRRTPCQRFT